MMDFHNIVGTTTDQDIRAWSVEKAVEFLGTRTTMVPQTTVIDLADRIEEFVKTGK